MIPVTQDIFGVRGNCLTACMASIFELPIREVPYFAEHNGTDHQSDWFKMFWHFCRSQGYEPVNYWLERTTGFLPELDFDNLPDHLAKLTLHPYYIQSGPAARGFDHATVGWRGQIIHDPHPSRAGLIKTTGYMLLKKIDEEALEKLTKAAA